ncbi:7-cyano-7-deazaguanine synthase QueC [Hydrogenimonas sp.]
MKKAVVILSGGMDSATAAFIAKSKGFDIVAVHFDYRQRTETREKEAFEAICDTLNVANRYVIDLPFFEQIGASALTDRTIEVPTGGIEGGVPVTYVPFRNGIFLSIAAAVAEKENAEAIYIGVVEEDSSGYPDCRESFIEAMERAIDLGTKETTHIHIETPLVHLKKEDIVKTAIEYGVPLELTWSCYKNEDEACGVCDSCRLRLKGFEKAGMSDPIAYKRALRGK